MYERAGAVVLLGDRVLLVSMEPPGESRWWHFPGGGIESGETAAEAAVRELFEETGLRAVGAKPYLRAGIHGGHHHYFLMTCDELELGDVTGPELVYAADADFRAEWVPIDSLASMPVFPRCVAEEVATRREAGDVVPWVEDDRNSWDGLPGAEPPPRLRVAARAVIVSEGRLAAIERVRGSDRYFTLPGGGVQLGETAEAAIVREVSEEVGLVVEPIAKLAVVVDQREGRITLQTYFACRIIDGTLECGADGELAESDSGATHHPVWLDVAAIPASLRPVWLVDRLPTWSAAPPSRPERFVEVHDD